MLVVWFQMNDVWKQYSILILKRQFQNWSHESLLVFVERCKFAPDKNISYCVFDKIVSFLVITWLLCRIHRWMPAKV